MTLPKELALAVGGVASWFASAHPDGLEWAMARVTGGEGEVASTGPVHQGLAAVQEKTAILPDYAFKTDGQRDVEARWPAVKAGTSAVGSSSWSSPMSASTVPMNDCAV